MESVLVSQGINIFLCRNHAAIPVLIALLVFAYPSPPLMCKQALEGKSSLLEKRDGDVLWKVPFLLSVLVWCDCVEGILRRRCRWSELQLVQAGGVSLSICVSWLNPLEV